MQTSWTPRGRRLRTGRGRSPDGQSERLLARAHRLHTHRLPACRAPDLGSPRAHARGVREGGGVHGARGVQEGASGLRGEGERLEHEHGAARVAQPLRPLGPPSRVRRGEVVLLGARLGLRVRRRRRLRVWLRVRHDPQP